MSGWSQGTQLILPLGIHHTPSLNEFLPGPNSIALQSLREVIEGHKLPFIQLWGESGTGKTHLLLAACREINLQGKSASYIPLANFSKLDPQILNDLHNFQFVCLDDLDELVGKKSWEHAFFHFYNRLQDRGGILIQTSIRPPHLMGFDLPDLASRLSAGLIFQLNELSDDDKITILKRRAEALGFELQHEIARYMIQHLNRNLTELCCHLDRLSQLSIAEHRKLTLPFVRLHLPK